MRGFDSNRVVKVSDKIEDLDYSQDFDGMFSAKEVPTSIFWK